ncbi:MAG: class I SAM-dependent methyltransferase [Burkholderiaceae bacterium]|nr:MAG: class I SAM-dependent methyltransferase [Burkholderiaceae bacterium]
MNISRDLLQAASATLDDYSRKAEQFRLATADHDVSQNRQALLRHITAVPPFRILDFGCGPGRDLKAFTQMGHVAIGLDGTHEFVDMARHDSGCEVWHQNFLALDLPLDAFDGVFANASLFHVPAAELPRVLGQLYASLKPDGVLFCSNPRGQNQEGWYGDRYGVHHDLQSWTRIVSAVGFVEIEHYYRPAGLPREQQPWLATVWRKGHDSFGRESSR